jgi:hypothetical protein
MMHMVLPSSAINSSQLDAYLPYVSTIKAEKGSHVAVKVFRRLTLEEALIWRWDPIAADLRPDEVGCACGALSIRTNT